MTVFVTFIAFIAFISFISISFISAESVWAGESASLTITQENFYRSTGIKPADCPDCDSHIAALDYSAQRVLRAMSSLKELDRAGATRLPARLGSRKISFEAAQIVEFFTTLPGANAKLCFVLLDKLDGLPFSTMRVLASLHHITKPDGQTILQLVDRVQAIGTADMERNRREASLWTIKALFEQQALQLNEIPTIMELATSLTTNRQWIFEQLCRLPQANGPGLQTAADRLNALAEVNVWNLRELLRLPEMNLPLARQWLDRFWLLSTAEQNSLYPGLPEQDRHLLLTCFLGGGLDTMTRINRLHAITDEAGYELGDGLLAGYSADALQEIYLRLPAASQARWQNPFNRAIRAVGTAPRPQQNQGTGEINGTNRSVLQAKRELIRILHKATEDARLEVAETLCTANIYTLLADGSDLYTSSFREILVPELQKRIQTGYEGDLLNFLAVIDPEDFLVGRFITSLASRGALTRFLPAEALQQNRLLDKVVRPALASQNGLLLFSASFDDLLAVLLPQSRSHLIALLLAGIDNGPDTLRPHLSVIVQHFLAEGPQSALISPADVQQIRTQLNRSGRIDTTPLTATPFAEWLQDRRLQSLSIFQRDDDGRNSCITYCQELASNGYRPTSPATSATDSPALSYKKELANLLGRIQRGSPTRLTAIADLFRFQAKYPIVVDWKKRLPFTAANSAHETVEISHRVAVYQSPEEMEALLLRFFKNDYELFAQRGHSYWRSDQLLKPMAALIADGRLGAADFTAKQRLLTLGSCGGIKAYNELNELFQNRVDILATVGIGTFLVNNPYNRRLLELVATRPGLDDWAEVTRQTAPIFRQEDGDGYIQPGSLPALLHKLSYHLPEGPGSK